MRDKDNSSIFEFFSKVKPSDDPDDFDPPKYDDSALFNDESDDNEDKFTSYRSIGAMIAETKPDEEEDDFELQHFDDSEMFSGEDDDDEIDEIDLKEAMANLFDTKKNDKHRQSEGGSSKIQSSAFDEFTVAQEMMDIFSFVYCGGSLYVFTNPGYEILDDNALIAKLKAAAPHSLKSQKPSFWSNVIKHIKTTEDIHISLDEVSHPVDEVVFQNGCFNVWTKKFRDATPEDYIAVYNHISYDKKNSHEGTVTEAFFDYISGGDEEIKELAWSTLGAIIAPHSKFKKFFVLYGSPDSGKSVFGSLCEYLVGKENCSHIPLPDLCGKYSAAQLHGKMLNTSFDTPACTLSKLGNLKMLTSGGADIIEAEKKYGTHKKIRSDQIKLMFASNNALRIDPRENIKSFRNRIILLPFLISVAPEDRDPNLIFRLMEEKDYIIRKALKAYKKLLKNNYQFPFCKRSEELLNEWFPEDNYSILDTLDNYLQSDYVTFESNDCVTCSDLYENYEMFCSDKNTLPMRYNTFIRHMRKLPLVQDTRLNINGQSVHALRGIQVEN